MKRSLAIIAIALTAAAARIRKAPSQASKPLWRPSQAIWPAASRSIQP